MTRLMAVLLGVTAIGSATFAQLADGSVSRLASEARQLVSAEKIDLWDAIVVLDCGKVGGTAFHIGQGRYITAAHVIATRTCFVNGEMVRMLWSDAKTDSAEFIGPILPVKLDYSCEAIKPNRHYLLAGYTFNDYGQSMKVTLPVIASKFPHDGLNGHSIFAAGDTLPGMSGGAGFNLDYEAVAVVLQRYPTGARPLRETPLCRKDKA